MGAVSVRREGGRGGGRPLRVLLVHANPFQQVTPVPPYGLECLKTAVSDLDVEVEILDPYLVAADPIDAAARHARERRPDLVGLGLRIVDDCIVIADPDAETAAAHDITWFMPEIRRLRAALGEAAPEALFLCGGAAFSAFPGECLDYLEVERGIVGAGEAPFRLVLERLASGVELGAIPGLVRRGEQDPLGAYQVSFAARPTLREPLYAPVNSFPVRTRIGCAMQCVYCLTANLGRRHGNGALEVVLDELEQTVAAAAEHGIERPPVFFADDELNLPDEAHAIAVLQGIVERGLADKLTWRAYVNPTPFSAELAGLAKKTNGHVTVTVDTASEEVMRVAQKQFRRRHLDDLVETVARHELSADLGLLFGLPGETEATLAETIAFVRSLPPSIEVSYSSGARVHPHTPLAALAREQPEQVFGADDPSFFEPVVFSALGPPRDLARRLRLEFAGLPHVRAAGVGFTTGRQTVARAYRVATGAAPATAWQDVLDEAERPGDHQRTPGESLAAILQIALWHERLDLGASAAKRLYRFRGALPAGVTRRQVRLARLALGLLTTLDRLKRAGRRGRASRGGR